MFKIDSAAGTWSLKSGEEDLTDCVISINDDNILKDSEIEETSDGFRAVRTLDGLNTEVKFIHEKDGWSSISLSLKNVSAETRYISKVFWFSQPLFSCFKNAEASLAFSGETGQWSELPGSANNIISRMVGCLSQGESGNAWIAGFAPPQYWASSVDVFVNPDVPEHSRFQAFIGKGPAPLRLDPDEEFVFDTLVLSCKRPALESFQAFGGLCKPRTPVIETKAMSGFNTWEYYRAGISAKACLKDLDVLSANEKTKDKVRYFILDHGWQKACGDWTFDVEKFGMDVAEWVGCVQEKGMIPGLWVAPFLAEDSEVRKLGTEPLSTGWGNTFALDPSDPVVIDHVCGQLKDLVSAGIKYFKTDFLTMANRLGMRHYKYSNRNGEAVFRNFFKKMREAIGEETFWLACGTDIASCAGLADAARISRDVKASFNHYKGHVIPRVMGRFWMHGNFWINDADFLLLKGEHLKPGCPHTLNDNNRVPFEGLTHDEATVLTTVLVITGSLVTWSDSPGVIDESGVELVSRCIEHCGGKSGIPLDFGKTPLPERWVKNDGGRLYAALLNFDDEEKTLSLSSGDVPELKDNAQFKDIFSDEEYRVSSGRLEIKLRPHSAKCLLKID